MCPNLLLLYYRCFECNEELSTHCNKKALAQSLDFLQKHSVKAASGRLFAWPSREIKRTMHIKQLNELGSLQILEIARFHKLRSRLSEI